MNNEDFDADFFSELDAPDDDFFAELDGPVSSPFDREAPQGYASVPAQAQEPGFWGPARVGGVLRRPVAGVSEAVSEVKGRGFDADVSGAYRRGADTSDAAAADFRKTNPKTAGVADAAADLSVAAILASTGAGLTGLGAGALGVTGTVATQALPAAAGGALGAGGLTAIKGGGAGDVAKATAAGAVMGPLGAYFPRAALSLGAGLGTADTVQSLKDGDTYNASRAIFDTVSDLGGAAVGTRLARRNAAADKWEPRLEDAKVQATERVQRDVRDRRLDLETEQGRLEAAKERFKIIPDETGKAADTPFHKAARQLAKEHLKQQQELSRAQGDLEEVTAAKMKAAANAFEKAVDSDIARVAKGEDARAVLLERRAALEAQFQAEQASAQAKQANAQIKTENREATQAHKTNLRDAQQELQREGRRQLVEAPEGTPESQRLKADFDAEIAQQERLLAERRLAEANAEVEAAQAQAQQEGVPNVDNHPAVVAAKAKRDQVYEETSPENINFRVTQKGRNDFQERMNLTDRIRNAAQDETHPPEIRQELLNQLKDSSQLEEDTLRRLRANKRLQDAVFGKDYGEEELNLYQRKLETEGQGKRATADARVEAALQRAQESIARKAQQSPKDPEVLALNALKAKAKEAVSKTRQAELEQANSPEATSRARQREQAKVDPIAAVTPERATEILRAHGVETSGGEDARSMLRNIVAPELRQLQEVPRAPSATERQMADIDRQLARLDQGPSQVSETDRRAIILKRAEEHGLSPEDAMAIVDRRLTFSDSLARKEARLKGRIEDLQGPVELRSENPWDYPELHDQLRALARNTGIDPDQLGRGAFEPGAAPLRLQERSVPDSLPDTDGRKVFRPGESLPANAARQDNLLKQFEIEQNITKRQNALADAETVLADLLGANEQGRMRLQNLTDQKDPNLTVGGIYTTLKNALADGHLEGTVQRLAAKDPQAALYFYKKLIDRLRVPEETQARFAAFVAAEGISTAERAVRIIYSLNHHIEDAENDDAQ